MSFVVLRNKKRPVLLEQNKVGWNEKRWDWRGKKGADDIGFIHRVKSLHCIFSVIVNTGEFCSGK